MTQLFNEIFFRPIFNALVLIYNLMPGQDFGVAIVILTVIIRLIFVPLSLKTLRSQRELARLQPKIKELQEKYKNDRPALSRATLELYKTHNVNPFSGCLPILIQLPVLIALYQAFRLGLEPNSLNSLYSFVSSPGTINNISLGLINLSQKSPLLAVTAGALQFVQSKLAAVNTNPSGGQDITAAMMSRQMLYFFPVMVIIISWNLPTGLVIYWVVTTLFSIFEQLLIKRKY